MCLLIIAGEGYSAKAQKAKAAKKVIELVTKGTKKSPKKKYPVRNKQDRKITPKPRPRTTSTVTCKQCNGNGKVLYWDSFTRQYQTAVCNKCDGKGKVRRN